MKHSNIAIFIPHLGCPNQCSFCNQNTITGHKKSPTPQEVELEIEQAISKLNGDFNNTEIAFFGGSFTAINRDYMLALLKIAKKHVIKYSLKGIRISTRPDCIDTEILDILKEHKVTAIELGAQSMVDRILQMNYRGHTSKDVEDASKMIKEYGFELGLQMMIGLYGETKEDTFITADKIISLKPNTVRIYPTVILKNTYLEKVFLSGEYKVFSLEDSVEICAKLLKDFTDNNIKVIKLGLHSSEEVEENMVGGIYHQAFRELCESKIYLQNTLNLIKQEDIKNGDKCLITVNPKAISKMVGQKRNNIKAIENLGLQVSINQDSSLKEFEVLVKKI